ncbi:MAG: hypothetical protein ABIA75_14905 [Candidatus Neomarinimicrobiota bacterium]
MDYTRLEIYQRLRDFDVPAAVLDAVFADENDLVVLTDAWQELATAGMSGDEIAREIAGMIFSELDNNLDLD